MSGRSRSRRERTSTVSGSYDLEHMVQYSREGKPYTVTSDRGQEAKHVGEVESQVQGREDDGPP